MVISERSLQTNLKIYPWYQATCGFLPWLAVFFLFFYERVSLVEALQLSAIYYFSVFVLEIPSGYFSDRFGRALTLKISAIFGIIAYIIFIAASNFGTLALGQLLLAGFFSFKSGSDNSLLYDSLKELGLDDSYAERESRALKFSMFSYAAAALVGGVSGLIDLRIPYVLSLLAAISTFVCCLRFLEPERTPSQSGFFKHLGSCLARLKDSQLLWLFAFFVLAYSVQHVVAEFNQPYVKMLQAVWFGANDKSALVSGVMVAISMLGGAIGANYSLRLMQRFGTRKLLLGGLMIIATTIAMMALLLHPLVLVFVLFRNFPMALSEGPMLAAIAPRISSTYRATYLSLQSLAGRLFFSVLLYTLSAGLNSGNQELASDWSSLQQALIVSAVIALFGTVTLMLLRRQELSIESTSDPE